MACFDQFHEALLQKSTDDDLLKHRYVHPYERLLHRISVPTNATKANVSGSVKPQCPPVILNDPHVYSVRKDGSVSAFKIANAFVMSTGPRSVKSCTTAESIKYSPTIHATSDAASAESMRFFPDASLFLISLTPSSAGGGRSHDVN